MNRELRHPYRILFAVLLVVLAVLIFVFAERYVPSTTAQQAQTTIKNDVVEAAVQCFAIEGAFPSNISYLEKNYGLRYNQSDFIVTYECFASNVMPEVEVLARED